MKRFVTEYASFKLAYLEELKKEYPHNDEIYIQAQERVKRAVTCCERGIISIDECMSIINRPLEVGVIG